MLFESPVVLKPCLLQASNVLHFRHLNTGKNLNTSEYVDFIVHVSNYNHNNY